MFRSLRFKIIVFLIIANGLSFVAMSIISYEISNKRMNAQLENQSMVDLRNTVANLNTMLSLRLHEAEVLTDSEEFRTGTRQVKLNSLKNNIEKFGFRYEYYGIAERTGALALTDGRYMLVGQFPAFQEALLGISSISDPVLDADGKPIVWLFVPLYDQGNPEWQITDVAALAVDSFSLFHPILSVKSDDYDDSSITLIDRDMDLLHYSSSPDLILKRNYIRDEPSTSFFAEQIRMTEQGKGDVYLFGRVLKMFYVKVPGHDWYAVFTVSKTEFEAPLRAVLWNNMTYIGAAEIVLGVFLYLFTSRIILSRLKLIAAATQQVASGDFYTPSIPTRSKDELGLLADSVNSMTEKLRYLFEPFQTFIKHYKYAMIVTDAAFRVTAFNTRAQEMLDYSESEVIGKRMLLNWYDPIQVQTRAKKYSEQMSSTMEADESVIFFPTLNGLQADSEWILHAKNGGKILVSSIPSVMRHPDGSIKGYVLLVRDISELKQTAATNTRLFEIMESAHDMISTFDLHGRMFYVNQAGLEFLGIDELNDSNNQLKNYLTISNALQFADGLQMAERKGYWQSETEFVHASGELQTVSMIVVPHRSDDGGETFYSTIVRDITDRKTIERQLLQAKEAADEANEAKSSFLARMSHEIRTPLNGIIGLTYLLQKSDLTAIQQDYLRQITDSSHNLLHILNAVLDFSKLEADKLSLEHVPFRLDESIVRLGGMFSVLLGPKPVDFMIQVDPRIPDELIGDPTRLEQVLLNLGSNAIKFTNEGLIEMQIKLTEMTDNQATLSFSVSDTGIGMTRAQLSKLFTPFVQADDKTSRKYGGTGLGLVISHSLVDRMGGNIQVVSTHDVGSTFAFSLRFELPESTPHTRSDESFNSRVLVLEDQPIVGHHWRLMLESMGCECSIASCFEEVLELLAQSRWDIAIIDMEAGDMHGEETWAAWVGTLRAHGIKVVSSTSLLGRDALQYVADDLKPEAVLTKPVSTLQVRRMLQVVAADAESRKEAASSAESGQPESHEQSKAGVHRVLVVDDQELNRLVAQQLLEQHGFDVLLASSGESAIHAIAEQLPHAVLMDLHMPDMDGIETTFRLRKLYSPEQLPIIALTADVTDEQHQKCLTSGMNDIVTKPINPPALISALSRYLQKGVATGSNLAKAAVAAQDTPYLQTAVALNRLSGKRQLYVQLLEKFDDQYSNVAQQLQSLTADPNLEPAIRLAHSLSGASGHLGADMLQHAATALEQALRNGQAGHSELHHLEQALDLTMPHVRAYIRHKK
ncbi:response regulator [Cohnella panacarvi]|uniref:response regulator n=1 Tax=Cohnella panacarvi TaxID=400776 RepID=UPI00047A3510|nr:response regulator [Cohnella panacarvi]